MNNKYLFTWLILLAIFVDSCKSTKSVTDVGLKSEMKRLAPYMIDYKWFEAKSNTTYAGGFNELSFVSNFRLQKDKVIWISVTGPLSIEGGRALITPDSVQVIDRINKKYYSGTFSAFCLKYQLPISFSQLQALLIGNVIDENTLKAPSKIENDYKVFEESTKESSKNVYINLKNYTVDKIGLKDRLTQRELLLSFANYTANKDNFFSMDRKIEIITHHERSSIHLEFSKFSFDKEVEFPFSVPEKYEVTSF